MKRTGSSFGPQSGETTKSTKMDHVLRTLRDANVSTVMINAVHCRCCLTGADFDAVTINHITDVNVAHSVYLSSEVSAKKAFSGMSDLFARVPSALKSLANDLAKNPVLNNKVTESVPADKNIEFVKASQPIWGKQKHDAKIHQMKRVEIAVKDAIRSIEHV